MKNIEIKAKCKELKKIEDILSSIDTDFVNEVFQRDTYFKVPLGMLKLRESDDEGNSLIWYKRRRKSSPKFSEYYICQTEHHKEIKKLLEEALGIKIIIEKFRKIYLYENVRIHLDKVKKLGSFIELEAVISEKDNEKKSRKNINLLIEKLNIKKEELIKSSYSEMP